MFQPSNNAVVTILPSQYCVEIEDIKYIQVDVSNLLSFKY